MRALHAFVIVTGLTWGVPGRAQAPPTPVPSPAPAPEAAAPGASAAPPAPSSLGAPQPAASPQPAAPVPVPVPGAANTPPASTAPPAPQCTLDEPCVRADRQGYESGRYWFEGFVDIRAGEVRIQADRVDLEDQDVPGAGGKTRLLTATGNVVFMREEERLAGTKLTIDLGTTRGTFAEAAGYLDPGVFIEGRSLERLAPDKYRIHGGRFTSCAQPNPRWGFSASTATIHLDRSIKASNVVFKVKSVPALYFPYLVYPIRGDQRSTGFLFPHFGYSSVRGFNIGSGFFWAMGRSFDQTFYADSYSNFGYGLGHEFRYVLDGPSRGVFRSYALRPRGGGDFEYDLDWNALQLLPGRMRASVVLRKYSSVFFQTRIQDNLNLASTRTQTARFNVQKNFGATLAQVYAESNDTFFGQVSQRINRKLPGAALTRRSQRLGRSPLVFAFEARADILERGDEQVIERYARADVAPSLSLPLGTTWVQLTPSASVRYTRYAASLEGEIASGPPIERRFFEGEVEVAGPNFSRVWNTPGNGYSEKFKHVIGPEIAWRYRTHVDDFDLIPKFDPADQFLGTNQVEYALVNRLLAKRPSAGGTRTIPYEFLTWRVSQTYYVDIAAGQNEFDPNYSSSSFGPGGRPDHNSPILSRVRLRPTPRATANFDLEYDINYKQVRRVSLSTAINSERGGLQVSWSRALKLAEDAARRLPTLDTLRGSGSLRLFGDHLSLVGSADYDALRKTLIQSRAQVRWDVQCCGFTVELLRYDFNQRQERQFRFAIELANVGSVGNFAGAENRRLGLGGYR